MSNSTLSKPKTTKLRSLPVKLDNLSVGSVATVSTTGAIQFIPIVQLLADFEQKILDLINSLQSKNVQLQVENNKHDTNLQLQAKKVNEVESKIVKIITDIVSTKNDQLKAVQQLKAEQQQNIQQLKVQQQQAEQLHAQQLKAAKLKADAASEAVKTSKLFVGKEGFEKKLPVQPAAVGPNKFGIEESPELSAAFEGAVVLANPGFAVSPQQQLTYDQKTGRLVIVNSANEYKVDVKDINESAQQAVDVDKLFDKISVKTYYDKRDQSEHKELHYGLSAEEIEQISKDLVIYDDKGVIQSVKYGALNILALEQIKRQKQKITELEKRLADVEAVVKTLKV